MAQDQHPNQQREARAILILRVLAYIGGIATIPLLLLPVMGIAKWLLGQQTGFWVGSIGWMLLTIVSWIGLGWHVRRNIGARWILPYFMTVSVYVAFMVATFLNAYLSA